MLTSTEMEWSAYGEYLNETNSLTHVDATKKLSVDRLDRVARDLASRRSKDDDAAWSEGQLVRLACIKVEIRTIGRIGDHVGAHDRVLASQTDAIGPCEAGSARPKQGKSVTHTHKDRMRYHA